MRPLPEITPGTEFGYWTVIEATEPRKGKARVLCRCECGVKRALDRYQLTHGKTKSCGCHKFDALRTHGETGHALYNSWSNMVQRCTNPKHPSYCRYGARGISVCDEWRNNCEAFVKWAQSNGFRPGLSIERINNNKGYCPENCRWATRSEQQRNRACNHLIAYKGETKCITEWAEAFGIDVATLIYRLRKWKDVTRAFEVPVKRSARCRITG